MLLCSFPSYNFVSRTLRVSTLTLGGCGFLFPLEDLQNLRFHCLVGNSFRVLRSYFVSRPSDSPPSNSLKHESLFWCPCLRSVRETLPTGCCFQVLASGLWQLQSVGASHTSLFTCLSCLGFPSYLCNSLSGGTKSGYSWTTTPQPAPSRSILPQRWDK